MWQRLDLLVAGDARLQELPWPADELRLLTHGVEATEAVRAWDGREEDAGLDVEDRLPGMVDGSEAVAALLVSSALMSSEGMVRMLGCSGRAPGHAIHCSSVSTRCFSAKLSCSSSALLCFMGSAAATGCTAVRRLSILLIVVSQTAGRKCGQAQVHDHAMEAVHVACWHAREPMPR